MASECAVVNFSKKILVVEGNIFVSFSATSEILHFHISEPTMKTEPETQTLALQKLGSHQAIVLNQNVFFQLTIFYTVMKVSRTFKKREAVLLF